MKTKHLLLILSSLISLSAFAVQKEPDTYYDEQPGNIYTKEFQPYKASSNGNFDEPHRMIYEIAQGRRIEYAINLDAAKAGKPLSYDSKFNRDKLAVIRMICPRVPEMKYNCWVAEHNALVMIDIDNRVRQGGKQLTPDDFPNQDKQFLVRKYR